MLRNAIRLADMHYLDPDHPQGGTFACDRAAAPINMIVGFDSSPTTGGNRVRLDAAAALLVSENVMRQGKEAKDYVQSVVVFGETSHSYGLKRGEPSSRWLDEPHTDDYREVRLSLSSFLAGIREVSNKRVSREKGPPRIGNYFAVR